MKRKDIIAIVYTVGSWLAVGALLFFWIAPAHAQTRAQEFTYGQGRTASGSIPLKLDFYPAAGGCSSGPKPVVMFIHGGGFSGGDKGGRVSQRLARSFGEQGWHTISINYRLMGDQPVVGRQLRGFVPSDAPNPRQANAAVAAIEDTVAALEFTHANASQACIDPSRIALMGSSAGAYTALQVGYALDEFGIDRPEIAAVVNYWGALVVDNAMDRNDVPMFMLHGTRDRTVDFAEAEAIAQSARSTGTPLEFHAVQGGGHGHGSINSWEHRAQGELIIDHLTDFLGEVFAGRRPESKVVNSRS